MLNIFTKPKKEKGFGAEIDTRPDVEQMKDYEFEEIVASADPVRWIEKEERDWRKYPIYDQNGSGSCVAQTMAKIMGIMHKEQNEEYVHFSATDIYQRRSNKPGSGMIGINAFQIAQEGVTLEALVPSQNLTDTKMDNADVKPYERKVGDIFKVQNYLTVPTGDIDTIASIIQKTGKPVMTWFYFKIDEWKTVPVIKDTSATIANSNRHSVTAVDYTLYNGKKALIIEDSWGPGHGKGGRRIITEDFFKVRNWFNAYAMNLRFEIEDNGGQYTDFTETMDYGERSDNVARMQTILKRTGHFPVNVESTGYYGNITAKAVYNFQVAHNVAGIDELNALQGRVVGPKTLKALNNL